MDYLNKLDIFNLNTNNIKLLIKKKIKNNLIVRGSGGSDNIVIINLTGDIPFVIKIIPIINHYNYKKQQNNNLLEIEIYKKFTNEFINITPHLVYMYNKFIINNNIILPNNCLTIDEKINKPYNGDEDKEHLCQLKKYKDMGILNEKTHIIILEYCPTNISDYIENFLKNYNKYAFIKIINRIIFQVIYTLAVIQNKYPKFIHNDLFLRNILAIIETKYNNNDYVEYIFNNNKYYFPANGIYIKINDFNYSLGLNENETLIDDIKYNPEFIYSRFEYDNPVRDIYTFLFDFYDGGEFGSKSVKTLINENIDNKLIKKDIIHIFKKEIKKYFNYKTIDRIKKNYNDIDDIWNISESNILKNTVKKPKTYFDNNIFNKYTTLPPNSNIVKSFMSN